MRLVSTGVLARRGNPPRVWGGFRGVMLGVCLWAAWVWPVMGQQPGSVGPAAANPASSAEVGSQTTADPTPADPTPISPTVGEPAFESRTAAGEPLNAQTPAAKTAPGEPPASQPPDSPSPGNTTSGSPPAETPQPPTPEAQTPESQPSGAENARPPGSELPGPASGQPGGEGVGGAASPAEPGLSVESGPPESVAPENLPLYTIEVNLNGRAHTLTGSIRVALPFQAGGAASQAAPPTPAPAASPGGPKGQDPSQQPGPEAVQWFHLPPNRFAEQDPRGFPRENTPTPYQISYLTILPEDPYYPGGFDPGWIDIRTVTDGQGRQLMYSLRDNPHLPQGYAAKQGLLRVELPPGEKVGEIVIYFVTHLPHRLWEGWNKSEMLTERWHPLLVARNGGGWMWEESHPSPARYRVSVTGKKEGWLLAGRNPPHWLSRDTPLPPPPAPQPEKSFPLIFLPRHMGVQEETGGTTVHTFFKNRWHRLATFSLDVAMHFTTHMERVYGLTLPQPNINLVQTEGPPDVIRTVGQTVLIPKGYYQNSRLLDRLYVGFLSSALARMWFGSTVWADENREAWLSYGLSGYFSLEYFDSLYGFDAPIHTITDWLAPRYREHYFEDPVRDLLRSETDSPLAATWEDNPHQQALRVATHNKAPLVFRSLAYVMGKENFIRTLQDYYRKNRFRSVHRKTFEQEAALHSVQPLGWYFSQWVDGTVPMDYALVDWEEERASLGYQITVTVARLKPGVMPVMVMVESTSGQKVTQTWNGRGDQTRLTFLLDQPLARVVLDPYEFLLETDRKNNFSAANLRFRPFFDWAKDREVLVSIQGRMGGNAVDGNHVGLGASFTVGQDDDIYVIPGTGDKSHELLYSVGWTHNRLFNPNLSFFLKGDRYGGQETQQTGFSYSFPLPDRFALSTSLSYAPQLINLADPRIPDAKPIIRRANHINFSERFSYQTPGYLWFGLDVSMEHSQEGLNSDLHYTITKGVFNQTYPLSSSHIVDFDIIRATTYGETPLVKKHLLGDPSVLRGYPRVLDLLYDDLAAMRLDYRWVFSRAIWGTEFQSRKWTLILSADAGKGWNHHESYELAPTRQNVAIGFELDVNVLSHLTFPIRVEFARPVNDPDYNKTQYIFFQALSFF